MKQLNFRHFNTNSKKFYETVIFFQKEANTAQKGPILFCSVYQGVFGHFTTIPDYFRRFPKATDDFRRLTKRSDHRRRTLQTLNSISFGNGKHLKLANLTANTKNYGQITRNIKPHSDPLNSVHVGGRGRVAVFRLKQRLM